MSPPGHDEDKRYGSLRPDKASGNHPPEKKKAIKTKENTKNNRFSLSKPQLHNKSLISSFFKPKDTTSVTPKKPTESTLSTFHHIFEPTDPPRNRDHGQHHERFFDTAIRELEHQINQKHSTPRQHQVLLPAVIRQPPLIRTTSHHDTTNISTSRPSLLSLDDAYGDKFIRKRRGDFRIAFHNINRLPLNRRSIKSQETIWQIAHGNYDVLMIAEVGLCHSKLQSDDQWHERTVPYLIDSGAHFAYNTNEMELSQEVQYGGVGIITSPDARHRIIEHSKDPSGLGRWVTISIQGKEGHITTFVSAYRPCRSPGASSVYMQHIRALPKDQEPRKAFMQDLQKALASFLERGHHLVVGMDANEDVTCGTVASLLQDMGLRDGIVTHNHPQHPPATYNRNDSAYPIDAIWVSPLVVPSRAGFLAFDEGIPSDHRCLWLDVSASVAFGQKCPPITPCSPRRLKVSDPRLVKKYNLQTVKILERMDFFRKQNTLVDTANQQGWNPRLEKRYNSIHQTSLSVRAQVEQKIRKLPMGKKPWSPKLGNFRDTITFWAMMVKRKKGIKTSFKKIRQLRKRLGLPKSAVSVPLEECLNEQNLAHKAYKAASKKADSWRDSHITDLIQARADSNNRSKAVELRIMQTHERQRRQSRNVKLARGKLNLGKVTKVYSSSTGAKVECNTKQTIEEAILHENETRFSQSEDTPPMLYPLIFDMGLFAETAQAEDVLSGIYEFPAGISNHSRQFLQALQMEERVQVSGQIPTHITVEEHRQAWAKQKEKTSAEPSGLSFSHYKAGCQDDKLALFDCQTREMPYKFGFSPEAWQTITDVSILKKLGIYDVDQMRTIQLMHSEFNMNNKKLGRDVMRNAEKFRLIPEDQFGSRKRHRAIMAALNKRLTSDIWRQSRQAGAICVNDAKSCYDRIVHWVASLCLRWAGLGISPVLSMFLTLASASHYVSTAFGVSTKCYNKKRRTPVQGIGQGNGSGPAVWAIISAVLIRMMYSAGHGVAFLGPISLTLTAFVCYAFVDDTDIVQTGPSMKSSGEDVARMLQESINCWEGGLRTTGGALVPGKSHWYLVDFVWKQDHWEYRTTKEMPAELSVTNTAGTNKVLLARHEAHKAKKSLGVHLSMDGNNADQVAYLLGKTRDFALQIRASRLSHEDAWFAMERTIMKTLEYCLPAVTVSKTDWKKILAPLFEMVLPAAGFDRHFPRKILFAPKSLQGIGLMHPWHRQGIGHLSDLITETMCRSSITGHLMRHSLEHLRLELGLSYQFWKAPASSFKDIATPSWIVDLWNYTSTHHILIHDPFPPLDKYYSQDIMLMDVFSQHYKSEQLRRLNMCRLQLSVSCLSEITTVDGSSIKQTSWQGIPSDHWNHYVWPRSPPTLPDEWWDLWRQALSSHFCTPQSRRIRLALGTPERLPHRWTWYYSPDEDRVYKQEGHLWRPFVKQPASRKTRSQASARYRRSDDLCQPPGNLQYASIYHRRELGCVSLDGRPIAMEKTTRQKALLPLDPQLVKIWKCSHGPISDMAESIRDGTCMIVSDGSFKDGHCTSSFTMASTTRQVRITGSNAMPGPIDSSDSFRGELSGTAGALEMLRWIVESHRLSAGSALLLLDGDAALKKASSDTPIKSSQSSYDILQLIRRQRESLPVSLSWRWVEGHQDGDNLSLEATLNNQCDVAAKEFWQHLNDEQGWQHSQSFGEGWEVWLDDKKLTSVRVEELYEWAILHDSELSPQPYWETKHNIPTAQFSCIDWQASKRAAKSLPGSKQRFLPKYLTGFCGTNQREHFRTGLSSQCPRCEYPIEDARHIPKCHGSGAEEVWATGMIKLESLLSFYHTSTPLQKFLLSRLNSWYNDLEPEAFAPSMRTAQLLEALREQDLIGWHNFLLGRISTKWAECQDREYKMSGRRNTGRRWATSLIKKLFSVSWDMWDHRNYVKHQPTHHSQLLLRSELQSHILRLRELDHKHWLPLERATLKVSPYQLETWPIVHMKKWIASIEAIKKRVKRRLQTRHQTSNQQRELLQNWLVPTSNPQL